MMLEDPHADAHATVPVCLRASGGDVLQTALSGEVPGSAPGRLFQSSFIPAPAMEQA